MTVLFEDDFENNFIPYTNISGGIAVNSTHVHHGLKSAKLTAYGDSARTLFSVGCDLVYVRGLFYFDTLPGLNTSAVILWTWDNVFSNPTVIVYNDGGVLKWGVGWGNSEVAVAGNYTLSVTPTLTTGTWYEVMLKVEKNIEARLYLNGTSLGVAPSIIPNSQQEQLYIGDNALWFGALPHTNITYYVDCLKASIELITAETANISIVYPSVTVQEATKLPSTSSSPVTECGGTRVRTLRHVSPISPWIAK